MRIANAAGLRRSNSDKRIVSALNVLGSFTGRINSSANIGMTSPEMAALWNEKNPDNPIVLEPAPEQ